MNKQYQKLTDKIKNTYEEGVTLEQAEKLAGEFLHAMITVSEELKIADLDSRMKKSGLKAIKAAVYMEAATKTDKKPSDVMLQAIVDMDKLVIGEQESFDSSEVERESLQNLYNIFKEAHIFYRGVSKGRFE